MLIDQTFEHAVQRYLDDAGASLGEALMTFVPIPLAIAATAVVASAGFRRDVRARSGTSPAAVAPDHLAGSEGLDR